MQGGEINKSLWRLISEGVFDVLFPKYCLVCKKEGSYCCELCQLQLKPIYPTTCFGCHVITPFGEVCSNCQPLFSFDGVIISSDYEDEIIGSLIKQCKYRFVRELGQVMGWLVAEKVKTLLERSRTSSNFEKDFFQGVVTTVPLSKRRLRQREFNQAEIIAQFFASYFSLSFEPTLLGRSHRKPQASLSEEVRKKNVKDSFFIQPLTQSFPRTVFVIDDVITTGATLEEAARVLKENGVEKVWGMIVAKG